MITDWPSLRSLRNNHLKITDWIYCSDYWDTLSTVAKGEINAYRVTLRNLPEDHDTPEEALENFPPHPEWIVF